MRQPTQKRIQSNHSKDEPCSQEKRNAQVEKLQEMFNNELEGSKSKQRKVDKTASEMKRTLKDSRAGKRRQKNKLGRWKTEQ